MAIKCGVDIYGPRRIKPNDFGDTPTSPFAPLLSQRFHFWGTFERWLDGSPQTFLETFIVPGCSKSSELKSNKNQQLVCLWHKKDTKGFFLFVFCFWCGVGRGRCFLLAAKTCIIPGPKSPSAKTTWRTARALTKPAAQIRLQHGCLCKAQICFLSATSAISLTPRGRRSPLWDAAVRANIGTSWTKWILLQ